MQPISFREAVRISKENVIRTRPETVPVDRAVGRIAAVEVRSLVDSPCSDVSVKDGYAVQSHDVAHAERLLRQREAQLEAQGPMTLGPVASRPGAPVVSDERRSMESLLASYQRELTIVAD